MTRCTPVITHNKNISTPPTLAGLFFCLASAEGAGLLFLPCSNTATNKRLQRVLYHPCSCTAHAAKHHTGLYSGFSCGLTHSAAHDTRPTQADIIPTAQHWSVSQRPDSQQPIPDTSATPGRYTGQHRLPIIIMYIRVRPCRVFMPNSAAYRRPCKPGGVFSHCVRIAGKF